MIDVDRWLGLALRELHGLAVESKLMELLDAGKVYLEAAAKLKRAELKALNDEYGGGLIPQEESMEKESEDVTKSTEDESPWLGAARGTD